MRASCSARDALRLLTQCQEATVMPGSEMRANSLLATHLHTNTPHGLEPARGGDGTRTRDPRYPAIGAIPNVCGHMAGWVPMHPAVGGLVRDSTRGHRASQ